MSLATSFLTLGTFILIGGFAIAQAPVEKRDSISNNINIESNTARSSFTAFFYRYFYKNLKPETKKSRAKRIGYKKLIQKPYNTFNGKIIRHITIETLDPFKNSIADTIEMTQDFLSRNGNKYHLKSRDATIRNQLLIKENQPFDSLLVKESERLVRSNDYIGDVSFIVRSLPKNPDSVDVFIRALDNWSIIPRASISASRSDLSISENNFLGMGHLIQSGLTLNPAGQDNSFQTSYFIPSISNTFISGMFNYQMVGTHYSNRSIAFNRSFFSPLTKWAAGVELMQQFHNDSIRINNSMLMPLRYKNNIQDYWAGYALKIFKGNSVYQRSTNLVSTLRYLQIHYYEKPLAAADPMHFYTNENFYMASIGISTRRFVQDKFIFKFGITEDIPIGAVYKLTGGYQEKNSIGRYYLSSQISMGNYYSWGYLSTNVEYGTFFNASHTEQSAVSADAVYFTGLIEIGKWKFRQFVKPQITLGIKRLSSDSLMFNVGYGLDGFKNSTISGNRRFLLTLQTQSYTPWNFIGFRFGPFLTYSLGILSGSKTGLNNNKIYSQIGLGVLIKNESLILNTFQLSVSFYPLIPGIGHNVFKINSFKTSDLKFRDFEIGKPATVEFR